LSLVENALRKLQKSRTSWTAAPRPEAPATGGSGVAAAPRPPGAPRSRQRIALGRDFLRSEKLLPPAAEERQTGEEYRQIKRQLLANALGRGAEPVADGCRMMVTSAMPGEGKTFTSLNLALSLAQEPDHSVLLIDADVAKAHLSQLLGVEKRAGLLEAIEDEAVDVEDLVCDTDVPGLAFLGAGHCGESASELLGSSRMSRLLQRLVDADPQRFILLDSSPLLLTNESRALAPLVGQVVMVVHAGATPQKAVHEALSHLGQDKVIGFVLNQSDAAPRGGYYYYGRNAAAQSPP
jgi:exopolysaccharide/PEP-CTERM locus tyrosine autokinase